MSGSINRQVGDWTIKRRLGSGSFATVWKAVHNTNIKQVAAIKEIDTERLNDALKERLREEIEILKTIKHENIVQFIDSIKEPEKLYLVLEYCNRGDLHNLMQRQRRITEHNARHFLRQLALGLREMRLRNLIHRDLKPQNLLLHDGCDIDMERYVLKIADFGFARNLQPQHLAETLCGSPLYMAPEILKSEKYNAKADLWSVGVIFYEMLVGQPPFDGKNHIDLSLNIEKGVVKIPTAISLGLSESCKDLLFRLLVKSPSKRVSFKEFFNHPFFKEGNQNKNLPILNGEGLESEYIVKEMRYNERMTTQLETVDEVSEACWICTESQDREFLTKKIASLKVEPTEKKEETDDAEELDFVMVECEEVMEAPAVTSLMTTSKNESNVSNVRRKMKVNCDFEILDNVALLISEFADSKREVGLEVDAFSAYYLAIQLSHIARSKYTKLENTLIKTDIDKLIKNITYLSNHMSGMIRLPNVYEMLYFHALSFGRGAGSEELMGNYGRSRDLYSSACLILYFLSDVAPGLDLDPPVKFSDGDIDRMILYMNMMITRRRTCTTQHSC